MHLPTTDYKTATWRLVVGRRIELEQAERRECGHCLKKRGAHHFDVSVKSPSEECGRLIKKRFDAGQAAFRAGQATREAKF